MVRVLLIVIPEQPALSEVEWGICCCPFFRFQYSFLDNCSPLVYFAMQSETL